MEYSKREELILPEYGRNIQNMVQYALTIEDREERMHCARTIINTMGNLFPYLRDVNDFKHKLWDHLAMMSGFKLDIDYPYEIHKDEIMQFKPEHIPYKVSKIHYLHYGRTLEQMIDKAVAYPEGEQRNNLISLIANHMKKCFLTWNKEIVDDEKIFKDLYELSGGKLKLTQDSFKLTESRDILNRKRPNNGTNNNKNSNNRRRQVTK